LQNGSNKQNQEENSKIDNKSRKTQSVGIFKEDNIDYDSKSSKDKDKKDKNLPKKVKKVAIKTEENSKSTSKANSSKDKTDNIKHAISKSRKQRPKTDSKKRF